MAPDINAGLTHRLLKSLLRIIGGVLAAIPLILYPLLYFLQEKLIFPGAEASEGVLQWARDQWPDAEIRLTTPDGVLLHGWCLKPVSKIKPHPLLIYFSGNREEVTGFLSFREYFPEDWAILTVNYREYGLSTGRTGEKELFEDALLLYDHFVQQQPDVDKDRIVVMGRSLGTGVAVYLASQRRAAGVILVSPYDSVVAVAQKSYPYAPVNWLLKHRFDSLSLAPSITSPVLGLIAENDSLIPPRHSDILLAAWGGSSSRIIISNVDHNSITMGDGYWESIRSFLNML